MHAGHVAASGAARESMKVARSSTADDATTAASGKTGEVNQNGTVHELF